jgi:5-methylcytosine-specific restriction endonuclease McrA
MVLSYYQKNAERRGLSWELDRPTFEKLIAGACFYCGAVNSMTAVKHYDVIQHNGVDRSDPSKGYVDGNVVSCCKTCNNAKASMTVQDFLYWARRVVGHSLSI